MTEEFSNIPKITSSISSSINGTVLVISSLFLSTTQFIPYQKVDNNNDIEIQYSYNDYENHTDKQQNEMNFSFQEKRISNSIIKLDQFGVETVEIATANITGMYFVSNHMVEVEEITNILRSEDEMMNKLFNHRIQLENYGFISGIILGLFCLIPPLLSLVDIKATLPAAVMFFALPIFVTIRRQQRKEHN